MIRIAAVALLAGVSLAACRAHPAEVGQPDSSSEAHGRVIIEAASSGRAYAVDVELARTDAERERGLMFRESLPRDAGMLFTFEDDDDHSFWMKNTLIPLDMLFIDSDMHVAGIVQNAEPKTLTPRTVGKASRYVLEVNGGWCADHGVKPGDRVRFEGVPPG